MNELTPHYLLISESGRTQGLGRRRFVLRPAMARQVLRSPTLSLTYRANGSTC